VNGKGMIITNLNITVILAKAGIHFNNATNIKMDPRFREDDGQMRFVVYCKKASVHAVWIPAYAGMTKFVVDM
jgi:hypothetical protein